MSDPLARLALPIRTTADAIRWACILEATAPKPGNVYPGFDFKDLTYTDFIVAAGITAHQLTDARNRISARMLAAVQQTRRETGTNVNLGIVLLLGPIVAADQSRSEHDHWSKADWIGAIGSVLKDFEAIDSAAICSAINEAMVGGLGTVDEMDVRSTDPINIVEAMSLAKDRDRIALQYADNFADLFENVIPTIRTSIVDGGDVLRGIRDAHVRLLAASPDSLIARKNGRKKAIEIQRKASEVEIDDPKSLSKFDAMLRDEENHRLNPGTTADMIAAGLYVLLRDHS